MNWRTCFSMIYPAFTSLSPLRRPIPVSKRLPAYPAPVAQRRQAHPGPEEWGGVTRSPRRSAAVTVGMRGDVIAVLL